MRKLESKPPDPEKTRKRVETTLRKHELGEPLTEKELMIVQWVRYGGCHACGGSFAAVKVAVRPRNRRDYVVHHPIDAERSSC